MSTHHTTPGSTTANTPSASPGIDVEFLKTRILTDLDAMRADGAYPTSCFIRQDERDALKAAGFFMPAGSIELHPDLADVPEFYRAETSVVAIFLSGPDGL